MATIQRGCQLSTAVAQLGYAGNLAAGSRVHAGALDLAERSRFRISHLVCDTGPDPFESHLGGLLVRLRQHPDFSVYFVTVVHAAGDLVPVSVAGFETESAPYRGPSGSSRWNRVFG